ncbi:MAG: T9SS type A sorting domain-containing protein [Flavobacteriales bacterium]|nr:MAG: T9SS type A sorting domain-containing protein [Flavobacteriales bacterium]
MRNNLVLSALVVSSGLAAQAVLVSGTSLSVASGTALRVEGTTTWLLESGSSFINDGSVVFGPVAVLDEQPGAPITGSGTERTHRYYPAPLASEEPAGLGFSLTTTSAPDSLLIVRGHLPRLNNTNNESIARWFEVRGANGTLPGSTGTFAYDQSELNGIPEAALRMASNNNGGAWWPELNSTLDQANNTASASLPDSLGWFTLFDDAVITEVGEYVPVLNGFALFPTVANEEVTIVGKSHVTECLVMDASGRTVAAATGTGMSTGIDVRHLAPGTYVVRVNGSATLRFVKP